jgi:hypothetical protein
MVFGQPKPTLMDSGMIQRYPNEPHLRKHGPYGYLEYQRYKPWLRDDFKFRCVYCLERERWYPNGHAAFGVDHIFPKSDPAHKHLECEYENLLYSCNRCNSAKGTALLPDPTKIALGQHLQVGVDGSIAGLTMEGKFLICLLGLDTPMITETRRQYIRIARLFTANPKDDEIRSLYQHAFGYPDDFPDLTSARPSGNIRPEGLSSDSRPSEVYFT